MSNWDIASRICNGDTVEVVRNTSNNNGNIFYEIIGSMVVGLDSKEISLVGMILHLVWRCGYQSDKANKINRLKTALNALDMIIEIGNDTRDIDTKQSNNIEHPNHYNRGNIECIDALPYIIDGLDAMGGFYIGNVIKYIWRWKSKNGIEDLHKAKWYLSRYIKEIQGE